MTTDLDLMRFHVEALFTHDANSDLVAVNEPDGAPAPRFFIGRTRDGIVCRFRRDLDLETRRALRAACEVQMSKPQPLDMPTDPLPYQEILSRNAQVERTWFGPAYCIPRSARASAVTVAITASNTELLRSLLETWVPDVASCQPMIASLIDGRAVSVCCSGRRTNAAHEAAVETVTAYRNRGHGSQVVTAWAEAVYAADRIPLFSTAWENTASRAVMRKLEVMPFGTDLHVT